MQNPTELEIIEDDKKTNDTELVIETDEDETLETKEESSVDSGIITHKDGTKTVHLLFPIEVEWTNKKTGGKRPEEFTSFTFRRPNASDIEAMEKMRTDFNKARILFARLSGARDQLFPLLDAKDMNRINGAIASFLE